jgi:hypothetical protein
MSFLKMVGAVVVGQLVLGVVAIAANKVTEAIKAKKA